LRESVSVTTAQLFAISKAIEELAADPGFGLKLVEAAGRHKPALLAAAYAADYRDGLSRVARFNRLCAPDVLHFEELPIAPSLDIAPGRQELMADVAIGRNPHTDVGMGGRGVAHCAAPWA
jgi:hypothetical protein